MRYINFAWILFVILVGGCVTTQDVENKFRPGSTFQNIIEVGITGQNIPLPDGTWEVASSETTLNNHSVPILKTILFQQKNLRLSKAMYISTPLTFDNEGIGYVVTKNCSRDDMHYRETKEDSTGGDQDCKWVNHYRLTLKGSKYSISRNAGEYLERKGISYPNHLIQSGHRFASTSSFLTLYYYFAPNMDGFENYPRTTWNDSPWHPQNTHDGTKKEAYIRQVKDWTDKWHKAFKAGFSGLPPIFKTKYAGSTNVTPKKKNIIDQVPERLLNLKKLFNDGVISKDEYDMKRKTILDSL
jgi:hypothetical protein